MTSSQNLNMLNKKIQSDISIYLHRKLSSDEFYQFSIFFIILKFNSLNYSYSDLTYYSIFLISKIIWNWMKLTPTIRPLRPLRKNSDYMWLFSIKTWFIISRTVSDPLLPSKLLLPPPPVTSQSTIPISLSVSYQLSATAFLQAISTKSTLGKMLLREHIFSRIYKIN